MPILFLFQAFSLGIRSLAHLVINLGHWVSTMPFITNRQKYLKKFFLRTVRVNNNTARFLNLRKLEDFIFFLLNCSLSLVKSRTIFTEKFFNNNEGKLVGFKNFKLTLASNNCYNELVYFSNSKFTFKLEIHKRLWRIMIKFWIAET